LKTSRMSFFTTMFLFFLAFNNHGIVNGVEVEKVVNGNGQPFNFHPKYRDRLEEAIRYAKCVVSFYFPYTYACVQVLVVSCITFYWPLAINKHYMVYVYVERESINTYAHKYQSKVQLGSMCMLCG
jgi:hypothetical protein